MRSWGLTFLLGLGLSLWACLAPCARAEVAPAADAAASLVLLDPSAAGVEKRFTANSAEVAFSRSQDAAAAGMVVTVQPGKESYPGVTIKPEGDKPWDLSAFGHVVAEVFNPGAKPIYLSLRVDNEGDWKTSPWSCEAASIKPGAAGTVKVIFGFSYGLKPSFHLNPKAVARLMLFVLKSTDVQSFRIISIKASGLAGEKPPVDPNSVRVRPKDGVLFGAGVKLDLAKQIETKGGAQAVMAGEALRLNFPATKDGEYVSLKPAIGRWELVEACEVRVKVKNDGQTPTTPRVQLLSNGGPSDTVAADALLAAGAETEIVVPFIAAVPGKGVPVPKAGYYGIQKGTGTTFTSDATAAIRITAKQESEAALLVQSIRATAVPAQLPEWLGKRPPVEGDWVQTFNENFDGTTIDQTKWNIYGPNYWDKATHWSKDNLSVGNGVATLHFEKKHGYHNDNPNEQKPKTLSGKNESDYVCGYLDTFGKWVQRYGYLEARVKLPTAPGLWPTFWMMPDRGPSAGPEDWKRSDTGNGGMELDIMEHLTRWGPHRYNLALHWDGYGKEHKSVGSTTNYIQADKDGFITAGMLWTPGQAVFYGNGKELFRWEDARVSTVPSYFIIEFTTGGWDNNAVDDSKLPADYLLDYVRVWQRKDLASDVDGFKAAAKPAAEQGKRP